MLSKTRIHKSGKTFTLRSYYSHSFREFIQTKGLTRFLPDCETAGWRAVEFICALTRRPEWHEEIEGEKSYAPFKNVPVSNDTVLGWFGLTDSHHSKEKLLNAIEEKLGIQFVMTSKHIRPNSRGGNGKVAEYDIILPQQAEWIRQLYEELSTPWSVRKATAVDLVTGKAWSESAHQRNLTKKIAEIVNQPVDPKSPFFPLFKILHSRENVDWLLKQVRDRSLAMRQATEKIPDLNKRLRTFSIIDKLEKCACCAYKTVLKSPRIYPIGESVIALPKEIRKILMAGTVQVDCSCCQMVINSVVWDIPELQDFFRQGGNFWDEIITHCGCIPEDKPVFKDGIYSLSYGGGRRRLQKVVGASLGDAVLKKFRRNRYVSLVWKRRSQLLKQCREEGGLVDALGVKRSAGANPRTALVYLSQSWEQLLMLKLIEIIKQHPSLKVRMYLYDGLYVSCRDKSRARATLNSVKGKFEAAVQEFRAPGSDRTLSFPLRLEFKD